jgi:hypothetical protein
MDHFEKRCAAIIMDSLQFSSLEGFFFSASRCATLKEATDAAFDNFLSLLK